MNQYHEMNWIYSQNGAEKRKLEENGDAPEPKKREKLEAGELLFTGATDWKVINN